MKFFLLFLLDVVASIRAPLSDVAAAATTFGIVPAVIPSINLTTHLFVNYTQPAGSYINCDTQYNGDAKMFSLNDTGVTYTFPWDARSYRQTSEGGNNDFFQYRPEIVWEPENNTQYTLMMVVTDSSLLGPYINHYMVINIIGNNISTGNIINRFVGPATSDLNYSKYAFALYAQSGMLNLTANQTTQIEQRINFNVSTFLMEHNLTSAAGINWMFASGDYFGPLVQDALNIRKLDCFVPVEDAARARGIVPSVLPALNLTTHLNVMYNQPAGNFTNCDQLYVNNATQFRLNDTGTTSASPWDARSYRTTFGNLTDYTFYQPNVTWNTTNGSWYTLLMVDAGHSVNLTFSDPIVEHWMVVNIVGNNISSGDLVNPLLGPAPIDQNVHVYTFILYQQSDFVTISPTDRAAIQARRNFNLTNFTQFHGLGAPVGVNWLYSSADAWSPVVQDALNITKLNCLGAVEDAARKNDIFPRVVPKLNLTTRLSVSFDQPAGNYINCGQTITNNATAFSLNDTGVTLQSPWNTRSYRPMYSNSSDYFLYTPAITWTTEIATLYTLMVIDPLFIINTSSTWGPYISHYLVVNINGNNISTGDTVNTYLGPAPTDIEPHKYIFLVYPQTGSLNINATERASLKQRINFNLTTFLNAHNYATGAIGINWVYASVDQWAPVEQDALGFAKLDCFGAVEQAARANGIVPGVIPAINLTTKLSVRFVQPADTYTACSNEYPQEAATFNLSDTSTPTNTTPWNMRSYRASSAGFPVDYYQYAPEVHWVSEPGALYTLMMVDAVYLIDPNSTWGPYVQHWMAINIPNATTKGLEINPYLGPAPYEPNTLHKYTFVLYKQAGNITLDQPEINATQKRLNFNLPNFISKHNLSAANGINWGFAAVDPWALVELDDFGWMELDCFGRVQDTARALGIVPVILPALDLNTQLRVSFNQPAESYTNCESTYSPVAFNESLSDINVALVYRQPWDLRSYRDQANKTAAITAYAPDISWQAATGLHHYTLLVVDPVYLLNPQDVNGPFLNHYMVVNINDTDFKTGTVINPYFGPAPLDSLYHKYLFLLYRQPGLLNFTDAEIAQYRTRTKFDLLDFMAARGLGNPVGANWAFAQADFWSPVAQDYIGFKKLVCPIAPTPASGDSEWVHLTPGAFAAIIVIGSLIILGLLAYVCYTRSATKRVGTHYDALPGEGVRKTSVNRK